MRHCRVVEAFRCVNVHMFHCWVWFLRECEPFKNAEGNYWSEPALLCNQGRTSEPGEPLCSSPSCIKETNYKLVYVSVTQIWALRWDFGWFAAFKVIVYGKFLLYSGLFSVVTDKLRRTSIPVQQNNSQMIEEDGFPLNPVVSGSQRWKSYRGLWNPSAVFMLFTFHPGFLQPHRLLIRLKWFWRPTYNQHTGQEEQSCCPECNSAPSHPSTEPPCDPAQLPGEPVRMT